MARQSILTTAPPPIRPITQPDHKLRNAAIIGGSVLAAGGAVAFKLHGLKEALQRAAKKESLKTEAAALKAMSPVRVAAQERKAAKAAASTLKTPEADVDPHRKLLLIRISANRKAIDNLPSLGHGKWFPEKAHPQFENHVNAIMERVHADIPDQERVVQEHIAKHIAEKGPIKNPVTRVALGEKAIASFKNDRVNSEVNNLITARTDRVQESAAWQRFHETVVKPHAASIGAPVSTFKDKLPPHLASYGYSKPHGAIIDLKSPPDILSAKEIRSAQAARIKARPGIKKPGVKDKRPQPRISPEFKERASLGEPIPDIAPKGSTIAEKETAGRAAKAKKDKPKGLERLVKLIQFDINLKESRDRNGKFSSGGGPSTDPMAMQYAYHMPMINPNGAPNVPAAPRGAGRPPGSLNKRTIAIQQAHEAAMVQGDAAAQQPDAKSHPVLKAALIGAGLAIAGGIAAGPKISRAIKASSVEHQAVEKIMPQLLEGKHLNFAEAAIHHGVPLHDAIRMANKTAEKQGKPVEDVVARADQWFRENPRLSPSGKKSEATPQHPKDNPHLNLESNRVPTKSETKAAVVEATAQANLNVEKGNTALVAEQGRHAETENKLKSKKAEAEKLRKRVSETTQNITDIQGVNKQLVKESKGKVRPLSPEERTRAALASVKKVNGLTLADNEEAVLARHKALSGVPSDSEAEVASRRTGAPWGDKTPQQTDMFRTVNAGRATVGGGGSVVPEAERQKRIRLLTKQHLQDPETREIARAHGHSPEDVAKAKAILTFQGETNKIIPRSQLRDKINAKKADRDATVKALTKDVAAKKELDQAKRNATLAVHASFDEKLKKKGIKYDTTKHAEQRNALVREAHHVIEQKFIRQKISEGVIPPSVTRGLREGEKASVTAIMRRPVGPSNSIQQFALRLQQRLIEMRAEHVHLHELSSFIRDVPIKHLPENVRNEIEKFIKVKQSTHVAHYGMVADELVGKADPHNLAAARLNVAKKSRKEAADEVHRRRETKPILVMNDRIVDGHHFLAKAEHGKVSSSLHVIDLTPARFQMEALRPGMIELGYGDRYITEAIEKKLSPDTIIDHLYGRARLAQGVRKVRKMSLVHVNPEVAKEAAVGLYQAKDLKLANGAPKRIADAIRKNKSRIMLRPLPS